MSRLSPNVRHGEVEKPVAMKPPHAKAKERDKNDLSPTLQHYHSTPSVEPGSTTDERSRGQDPRSAPPPPPPHLVGSHPVSVHHPHPSIPHIPYLWDPRLDPRFAAMEGRLSYNRPIPVNSRTHEGRYHFEPYMNHPVHGYTPGSSPVMSDVSLIRLSPQRGSNLSTIPEYHYPYMPPHGYVDHLHGSPAMSVLSHARGLSPTGSHPGVESHRVTNLGPPLYSHQGLPGDLLSQRPSTAGSIEHPALDIGSVEGSRFSSPKPGGRLSRKRGLSISPLSGSFDIDAMIRNSPNSLVAYMNNSRSSSAASGSYGHLSAGTISPLSWHPSVTPLAHLQHLQQQLMRHNRGIFYPPHPPGVMAPPAPHYHHHPPANPAMAHLMARANGPTQTDDHLAVKKVDQKSDAEHMLVEHNNNLVSSSVDLERKKAQEEEAALLAGSSTVSSTSHDHHHHHKRVPPGQEGDEEGTKDKEEDVPVVTDCEWSMCTRKFQTLEQLVQHINNEHIHNERKEFVCRWTDCIREEKPFKAQYMLVVHMRRHTGEKPHKCTFEGCAKAYSRLENLKTHLRSHTGERPYVCEFQGCTKAFSNASDRAKHQNRTHSNAKPYVCKIPGCTKRYTDPSSLRKHVKTVHGPDAHVTKKMRSDKKDPSSGPKKEDNGSGEPGTPLMVKVEHSPITMKVEVEDGGSSGHACQQERIPNIKGDDLPLQSCSTNSMAGQEYSCSPHNDSGVEVEMNVSTGSVGDLTSIDDEKIQDDQISSNMGPPTEGGQGPVTTASQAGVRCGSPFMVKASRTKGKSTAVNRLAQKVKNVQPLPQLPPIIMKTKALDSKPKDRTVEKLSASEKCDSSQTFVGGNFDNMGPRRGSNTSTISSYLSSRRSSEASPFPSAYGNSRRSSQTSSYFSSRRTSGVSSQFSSHMGMMNSPFDINSMDSSRRSSEASSLCGPSGLLGLTIQDQRRLQMKFEQTINRQNGWDDRMGPSPSPLPPPPMAGYRRVSGAASLPPRTPLPHEVPGNEIRRASDPVKMCYDGDVNLPRYNSLNNVAPLPVPDAMRSLHPARNMETVVEGAVYQGGYHANRMPGSWGNNHPNGSTTIYQEGMRTNGGGRSAVGQEDLVLPDEMVQYLEDQREQTLQHHHHHHQQQQQQPPSMMMMNNEMGNHGYPSDYRGRQYAERQNMNMTGSSSGANGPIMGYGQGPHKQQIVPNGNRYVVTQQQQQQQHIMPPQAQNALCVPSQPMQMEMSPDCNQVTSTVNNDGMDAMAQGLANLSEDGMDHVQPLVPERIGGPAEMNGNSTVSNMVVNDMSSMLTSLAEENKYLNML